MTTRSESRFISNFGIRGGGSSCQECQARPLTPPPRPQHVLRPGLSPWGGRGGQGAKGEPRVFGSLWLCRRPHEPLNEGLRGWGTPGLTPPAGQGPHSALTSTQSWDKGGSPWLYVEQLIRACDAAGEGVVETEGAEDPGAQISGLHAVRGQGQDPEGLRCKVGGNMETRKNPRNKGVSRNGRNQTRNERAE